MRFKAALLAAAAVLALASDAAATGLAQLLPAGQFASRDGRPGPGKHWQLSDQAGAALAHKLCVIAAKTPIAIDYEHQSMLAATNGQPAPTAGYMVSFEWRNAVGLFARVNWTPRARAFIEAGEYRYISPVILFNEQTGEVVGLHNAALVSTPAILGMDGVQAALAARFNDLPRPTDRPTDPPHLKESKMDLTTLIALLGLAAGASVQDVSATIAALMARPAVPAALAAQLGLTGIADEAAVLAALTRRLSTPDPATLQQMTALQTQVAELRSTAAARVVAELVDGAIEAHKLTPAQRDWAVNLGKADLAQLSAFITSAPVIAGLAGQTHGRTDPAANGADGHGNPEQVALKAQAYQAERMAAGVHISTLQAVNHVLAAKA